MLKKPRILVVGSFMMDLIASTRRAPAEGETVIGLSFRTAPGGKGANQAVQCARLGAAVTMVGRVGADDFGRRMVSAVSAAGVDVSHVTVDENEASGVGHITLEVSEHDARNRITVCPGANYTLTAEHISWLKDEIGSFDIVLMQLELPMEITETVARWAHEAGVPVMLNPAPAAPLSDELLSCVTFLSPNEHEAALISGRRIDVSDGVNEDDLKAVAGWFAQRGVKKLIVTMGENGAAAADSNGISRLLPGLPCAGGGHHRRRGFVRRFLLHRTDRRTERKRCAELCKPCRRHNGDENGRHPKSAGCRRGAGAHA